MQVTVALALRTQVIFKSKAGSFAETLAKERIWLAVQSF
jgi:hypothetical protein